MRKFLLPCLLGLFFSHAGQAAPVLLETPMHYTDDASVDPTIKADCQIEEMVARDVGKQLAEENKGEGTIDAKADQSNKTVLHLGISYVMGANGGGWTGPKAITVKPRLVENGKVIREGRMTRWSTGGVFAAFKGTCSILRRCSKQIAEDMVDWINDPNYDQDEKELPKGVAASAPAASVSK